MGLSSLRDGAEKKAERPEDSRKEPLSDSLSKFDYKVTQRQLKLFIKIKAKIELRKIAETGEEKERRIEAVKGLAEIDDTESIPVLEEIMRADPEKEVRDEAGETILKLKGEARKFEKKEGIEELNIEDIIDEAIDFGAPMPVQDDDFPDVEIEDSKVEEKLRYDMKRIDISKFLEGDKDKLYLVVEYAIAEDNAPLKMMAIEALAESDDADALANIQLILDAQDENEMTKDEIEAKRKIKNKLTIMELRSGNKSKKDDVVKVLFHEKDVNTKKTAFDTLMEYKDPPGTRNEDRAIEDILLYIENMDDEDELSKDELKLKRYMLKELDKIRDRRYFDTFIGVLRFTKDPEIIDMMITSLYFYGDNGAIDVLNYTSNRDDIDESNRKNAVNAATLLGYQK